MLRSGLVTAACTIPILAQIPVIVFTRFIVIRMATGAVRLIAGCGPDYRFAIAQVAGRAERIAGMISRVSRRGMREINRDPTKGRVTGITLLRRNKMIKGLACGRGSIMAT